jgi:allantoate deiminase
MDGRLVETIAAAVAETECGVHRMVSGAGHDAMILAGRIPAGMLFVRTPGGLSHHPEESVAEPDVQAALDAMMRVLARLDTTEGWVEGGK